jgi:O-antigen/teichoic acid export membrane protein
MKRLRVLYVAGYARCGSTLLSRLLQALPESSAIGEGVAHFFRAKEMPDAPCGCGLPVEECPFWKDVNFSTSPEYFGSRLLQLRNFSFLDSHGHRQTQEFQKLLGDIKRLYERIAEKTGAGIIIDSSKSPLYALILSGIPEIDVSVVHLVRDPHSVVNSYRTAKEYLPKLSALRVTAGWIGLNIACEQLRNRMPQYRTLRYEDFVAAPRATIAEIAASLGYDGELGFVGDSAVELRSQHMLGGNPDKLLRGTVKIELRTSDLSVPTRVLVSLATAPWLRHYGYWGRRASTQVMAPVRDSVSPAVVSNASSVNYSSTSNTASAVNNIARDVATLVSGSALAAVFSALIVFVIPRITSVEDFGYWRLFMLYGTYVGFLHWGFGEGALLSWAGKSLEGFHDELKPSLKFLVGQHLMVLAPACLLALLLPPRARFITLAVLAYALLQNTATVLQYALQAARQFGPVAVAAAAPSGLFLLFAVLSLLRGTLDHRTIVCCYFLSWLLVTVFLWIRVRPFQTVADVSAWAVGKRYLSTGWPITLANTAFALVQSSDRLVLSSMVSIYNFAQYSLAASTMMVPLAVIAAVARVLFPHLAAVEEDEHAKMHGQALRLIFLAWSLTLPYYFAVDAFVHRFLHAYVQSLPVAMALLLGVVFVAVIQILQSSLFNLYGRQKDYLLYCVVAVGIDIGLAAAVILLSHSLLLVAVVQVIAVGSMSLFLSRKLKSITGDSWQDLVRMLLVFGWSALSLWLASSWTANLAVRTIYYWLLATGPLVWVCGDEIRSIRRLIRDRNLFLPSSPIPAGSAARD